MRNKAEYDIQDGMLGSSAGFASGAIAVVGVSAIVPTDIKSLSGFSKVESIFGDGPLRDFLEGAFTVKKKPTIYAKAIAGTTNGSVGSVTSTKTGIGTIAVSGNPRNEYDILIIIDAEGGLNAAVFHYVLDGVESKKITVPNTPGTYEIPNTGLTITFTPGTPEEGQVSFAEGDEFSFSTTAPKATNAELLDAVDLLLASKKSFSIIAVAGVTDKAFWTALNTRLETLESNNDWKMGVCEARYKADTAETTDEYVTALCTTERPSGSLKRVQVIALHVEETDLTSQIDKRSPLGKYCGHLAAVCQVQERPGKVKLGSISGLSKKIYPEDIEDVHLSDLDDAGYVTPVTYEKRAGLFFSRGRMMTELTSDFRCAPERRVLDKALSLVYEKQINYFNDDVMVSSTDGSPEGLNYFKSDSEAPLETMKQNKEISNFEFIIPEGQNILTDETLSFELAVTPKGYIGIIKGTVYYKNPALEVKE